MQVIVVAVVFAVLGVILGLLSPVTIPITYARYTAVALLAALDSIFGASKAYIAGTFEPRVFFSGLITNMTLAGYSPPLPLSTSVLTNSAEATGPAAR